NAFYLPLFLSWVPVRTNHGATLKKVNSQNYLFQIDQKGTFERQSKYYNIKNVCLSVSPLVALVAHWEGAFKRESKYNNINNVCLSVSPLVALFARSKV
ncbi:hypothetical protein SFRURICE_006772, partial [Spodoptera frugiperda]